MSNLKQPEINWSNATKVMTCAVLSCISRNKLSSYWVNDIVQDALLKAYQNRSKFDLNKATFSTWISTIAKRTYFDFVKKKCNKIIFLSEASIPLNIETVEYNENIELYLYSAIEHLNDRNRTLLKFKYLENKSVREIATLTGIPEKNVPVYIMRARQELKTIYSKIYYSQVA